MLVNSSAVLNYNRCRRFAALNDPFTALYLSGDFSDENSVFHDILLSHLYQPNREIRKNINLTYEFEHEVTLSENYDFIIDDKSVYCLLPYTSTEILELKYKEDKQKLQLFTKNSLGVYTIKYPETITRSFQEKLDKLYSAYETIGRVVFSYALKSYILKKVYPKKNYQLYYVLLNSDYKYDGISYTEKLYHQFDFSGIKNINEIVEIALFRMINHLELNDFTPCMLVKKACEKNKTNECKFTKFCYSHLPENTSILAYFNSHLGFNELADEGNIHHDTYDLLNEGYVSMQDVPISWLKDQNRLMQRYCVDNQSLYYHLEKIKKGLMTLKYPIYYLDFEALPQAIPKFIGESPYSQSVFQYSLHIENQENELASISKNHFGFIANPNKDEREDLLKNLIKLLSQTDSSIVVYNKTFEKTRLEELKEIFPNYRKEIDRIISRLFDLLDIVKINKSFYQELGFKDEDLETYNLYHPDLNGSYSLKKVIKLFNPDAYDNLVINDGVKAYKAYLKMADISPIEAENTKRDLFLYCRQDTYSMYQIIQGLKQLISPDFTVKNS
ncbi:MAG: DUF2779 domain-containing protein [Candidatus Izemoplasmatales bacterium]